MPVWHERTRQLRASGKLQLVGLIQEQHPDRCALYKQWQRMGWPVLVDSLNRTGVTVVPLYWAIDEHGVLRRMLRRPQSLDDFLATDYPAPSEPSAVEPLDAADRAFLEGRYDDAIAAYHGRTEADPQDGEAWFRLGCSYRARHDSPGGHDGDFQDAVDAWTRARSLRPGNYIFRRRIQQYGPRLDKPYPFYDWIPRARAAILARGETPHALRAEPEGSEYAHRIRSFEAAGDGAGIAPDPDGKLPRDRNDLVHAAVVVAPRPLVAGRSARVYLRFTPDRKRSVTWDNEAGPLAVWVDGPGGWSQSDRLLKAPLGKTPSSTEVRGVELEVEAPRDAKPGDHRITGYAVYYVCDGPTGQCTFLRRDFDATVRVVAPPPRRPRRR